MTYRKSIVGLFWLLLKGLLLTAVILGAGYLGLEYNRGVAYLLAGMSVVSLLGTLAFAISYTATYITVDNEYVTVFTQVSLFGTEVSKCELREVEDVLVNKSGLFRLMFNFGKLTVQTAVTRPNFSIDDLARPDDVKAQIIQLSTGI
jgi:ABC-type polysaccharide/polyol phosphate export permease